MIALRILLASTALAAVVHASESSLTATYQPLDGLGAGRIFITRVVCHDHAPGNGSAIGLISAANVPPTNAPGTATENLNLASVCGVRFDPGDLGNRKAPRKLVMDCSKLVEPPKRFSGYPREHIIRTCLECLRRCLPEELLDTPVTLLASNANRKWLEPIIREFNAHDRGQPFPLSS